jgi:phosphoglycolate phosphatase-like HAD superfamily hydrolase
MKARLLNCILFDLDGMLSDSRLGIEYLVRAASATCDLPLQQGSPRGMIGPPIQTILSGAGNISECASIEVDCTLDSFLQCLPLMAKELVHD